MVYKSMDGRNDYGQNAPRSLKINLIDNIKRYFNIILILTILFFVESCKVKAEDIDLMDFMAPRPGVTNIYRCSDGNVMHIKGLKEDSNKLLLQETLFFKNKTLPEAFPQKTIKQYRLFVAESQLIKKNDKGEEVVIQNSSEANKSWQTKGKTRNEKGKWTDITSACKLVSQKPREVLGEERFTIMTKCKTNNRHKVIRIEIYAKNIGLVERIVKVKSGRNSNVVFKTKLEKIKEPS